jgi:hypothetical protein
VLPAQREPELDWRELLRPHDLRHVAEPLVEEPGDFGARAEGRVVVEVDVQQHSDLRPERGHRAVRFVPLHHEHAAPRPRVAAELRNLAADEKRRIEAEPVETERDHSARRRLAVGSGDHDRPAIRDELGE